MMSRSDRWVVHENETGAWVEMPADAYADVRRMALVRGISMSEVLGEAWEAFRDE